MQKNKLPRPKTTLAEVIDENANLLTAIALFVALTLFSANLPIKPLKPLGIVLSFCLLGGSLMLFWEFFARTNRFPPQKTTARLNLFQLFLAFAFFAFVFYWLLAFREIWKWLLPFVFMWLIFTVPFFFLTERLFPRINLAVEEILEKKTTLRILVYISEILLLLLLIYIASGIALWLASPLNRLLDNMLHWLESMFK